MKLIRVGIDLAKNVFQVHGVDRSEKVTWRRRLRREEWVNVVRERAEAGCEIGMEACGGAHHWARELQKLGSFGPETSPPLRAAGGSAARLIGRAVGH